jgi:hypothetical protein
LSKKRKKALRYYGADELTEDAEEYYSVSCFLTVIDTAKHLSNEASNPGDSK